MKPVESGRVTKSDPIGTEGGKNQKQTFNDEGGGDEFEIKIFQKICTVPAR